MTQYLLSVHVVEGAEAPSEHAMQVAYGAVDTFNAKPQDKGALVFGGGLRGHHAPPMRGLRRRTQISTWAPTSKIRSAGRPKNLAALSAPRCRRT